MTWFHAHFPPTTAGFPLSAARDLGVTLFSQLRNVRGRLAQVQCSGNEACVAQCNVSVLYDQEPRDFAGVFCTGTDETISNL